MEALGAHSAYSTHYCSQEQGSEEEEDDEDASLEGLRESLQVTVSAEEARRPSPCSWFGSPLMASSPQPFAHVSKPGGRGEPQETGGGDGGFSVHAEKRRAGRE